MRTLRRFRFTAAAVSLLLALQLLAAPATTQATVSLCGPVATSGAGTVSIGGESADAVGECAIAVASGQPAWAWFDATLVLSCQPATGSGTTRQVEGFYLWGVTRNDQGAIVSQGYVGSTWTACGNDNTATRTYHQQLVLQGYDRTISVRTERRTWPYSTSSAVLVGRPYTGTAQVP